MNTGTNAKSGFGLIECNQVDSTLTTGKLESQSDADQKQQSVFVMTAERKCYGGA